MSEDWIPVTSSNLEALRFLPPNLQVRFKGGEVYSYANVPEQTFEALLTAESVGKTFHQLVKTQYPFTKVT